MYKFKYKLLFLYNKIFLKKNKYIIKNKKIPKKLKKTGINFKQVGKNSESNKLIFLYKLKIEFCQTSVPIPTKRSLLIYPKKILPILKQNKEILI